MSECNLYVTEQKVDASLDFRISSLQAYTREGQWRLQLISGMTPSAFEFQKSKGIFFLEFSHSFSFVSMVSLNPQICSFELIKLVFPEEYQLTF